jgi:hypothetical protein
MTTDITNQYLGNYAIENNQADFHKEVFRNDFSDKPIWQEIQAILADAEIYFKYPYEIILNEMNDYIREGESYEDTISEMERKMNMYLNDQEYNILKMLEAIFI